jgi:hypothetical protein
VSPPPNWSLKGRTAKDLSIRHVRAPQSASEVHGFKAWQPAPVIGHPLLLRFFNPSGSRSFPGDWRFPPPMAYGSCRNCGKRAERPSHSPLDGRPEGASHRLHRPGDEPKIVGEDRRLDHIRFPRDEHGCSAPPPSPPHNWTRSTDREPAYFEWAGMRAQNSF